MDRLMIRACALAAILALTACGSRPQHTADATNGYGRMTPETTQCREHSGFDDVYGVNYGAGLRCIQHATPARVGALNKCASAEEMGRNTKTVGECVEDTATDPN